MAAFSNIISKMHFHSKLERNFIEALQFLFFFMEHTYLNITEGKYDLNHLRLSFNFSFKSIFQPLKILAIDTEIMIQITQNKYFYGIIKIVFDYGDIDCIGDICDLFTTFIQNGVNTSSSFFIPLTIIRNTISFNNSKSVQSLFIFLANSVDIQIFFEYYTIIGIFEYCTEIYNSSKFDSKNLIGIFILKYVSNCNEYNLIHIISQHYELVIQIFLDYMLPDEDCLYERLERIAHIINILLEVGNTTILSVDQFLEDTSIKENLKTLYMLEEFESTNINQILEKNPLFYSLYKSIDE